MERTAYSHGLQPKGLDLPKREYNLRFKLELNLQPTFTAMAYKLKSRIHPKLQPCL
jgi:hypothetical protein